MTVVHRIEGSHGADGREFAFRPEDFALLRARVRDLCGISLPDSTAPMVYSRLSRRLRQLNLTSFADYLLHLDRSNGADEKRHLISAITTNTTRFFREPHHFDLLQSRLLPPLLHDAENGRRIRIWSAGCSSGEEPYSIAFTLLDLCPDIATLDFKILATDIDPEILRKASEALYPTTILAELPPEVVQMHFDPAMPSGDRRVNASARALVTYLPLNLIGEWPMHGPFDIILCRNVAIYFDAEVQDKLWRRFDSVLTSTGCLLIGHSERLSAGVKHAFTNIGMTSYRKSGARVTPPMTRHSGDFDSFKSRFTGAQPWD